MMSIKNEVLAELATARDEARLRAHLLSMDARERWRALEVELESLERNLTQTGERASESAVASARDLVRSVADFFSLHVQQSASLLSKPAATVMSHEVRSCSPTESLNRAAQIMWESNCGAVPVVNQDGLIVGMITDRDVCMASYTQGQNLGALTVEHAMSRGVKAALADEPVSRVLEIMAESQVRRVPVIQAGKVVGIVSLADIARALDAQRTGRAAACEALSKTLAAISQTACCEVTGTAHAAE
jgi:predicted transcriptional regulator